MTGMNASTNVTITNIIITVIIKVNDDEHGDGSYTAVFFRAQE